MAVVKSFAESVLTDDVVDMQFADYQVPGYRQDPAVIGNAGCYRIQVNCLLVHFFKLECRFTSGFQNIWRPWSLLEVTRFLPS